LLFYLDKGEFSSLIAVQFQSKGFNYGFVEYDDPGAAERAMQTLNGRRVHQAVSFYNINL